MLIDMIEQIVAKDSFEVLGRKLSLNGLQLDSLGEYQLIADFEINPAMCGPVGAMFSKLFCNVSVGYAKEIVYLNYEYRYEHPDGGRNGKEVRRVVNLNQE